MLMETSLVCIPPQPRLLPQYQKITYFEYMQVWADVKGYEGVYQVSNKGLVRSLPRKTNNNHPVPERLMALRNKGGYASVLLSLDSDSKEGSVHRLVATAFLVRPEGKPLVNHKDGNKRNNCWWNLEWVTAKENCEHAIANNLIPARPSQDLKSRRRRKKSLSKPHLTDEDVKKVQRTLELCINRLAIKYSVKPSNIRGIAKKLSGKSTR